MLLVGIVDNFFLCKVNFILNKLLSVQRVAAGRLKTVAMATFQDHKKCRQCKTFVVDSGVCCLSDMVFYSQRLIATEREKENKKIWASRLVVTMVHQAKFSQSDSTFSCESVYNQCSFNRLVQTTDSWFKKKRIRWHCIIHQTPVYFANRINTSVSIYQSNLLQLLKDKRKNSLPISFGRHMDAVTTLIDWGCEHVGLNLFWTPVEKGDLALG